jgi:hypothetical protein
MLSNLRQQLSVGGYVSPIHIKNASIDIKQLLFFNLGYNNKIKTIPNKENKL